MVRRAVGKAVARDRPRRGGPPRRAGNLLGRRASGAYELQGSQDGENWTRLGGSRHGEGGQEIFAFPPTSARFLRWSGENRERRPGLDIVEIDLYGPDDAPTILEEGRAAALGHAPIALRSGESITLDFRRVRDVAGALVEWGEVYGKDFSAYLSDDGEDFRELGRITAGGGGNGSFWWPRATGRFFRMTLHEASAPEAGRASWSLRHAAHWFWREAPR
jgi:hypothetical protein